MVCMDEFFAKMDFIVNINLDSSPPEAVLLNDFGANPLFAEKRKSTMSIPFSVS